MPKLLLGFKFLRRDEVKQDFVIPSRNEIVVNRHDASIVYDKNEQMRTNPMRFYDPCLISC